MADVTPRTIAGYGVHVLTASGAALGLMALHSVHLGNLTAAFVWLGLALFVDGIDGPLARRIGVKDVAARYDGAVLDLVVDYVTYVLVPAAMFAWSGLVPEPWGLPAALIVMATSALYFGDTRMKTDDWWFMGFPAVWNVVALYLAVFQLSGLWSLAVVILAAVAMFLPIPFVHPIRVRTFRALTFLLMLIWLGAAIWSILSGLVPGMVTKAILIVTLIYFLALGLLRKAD